MLESAFEIDDNIAIYDGYTDGTHWNGWACPWFTKETALEIVDAYNALMPDNELRAIYNETEDTFIFYGYDEAETEEFKGKDSTINGKTLHLYPVGYGMILPTLKQRIQKPFGIIYEAHTSISTQRNYISSIMAFCRK